MLPVRPSVWKGGSMASMASWLSRARMAATSRQLERMLSWLSGTPLGAADEPEVNRMAASGDGFRGTTQPSSPASERNVRQAASRRRQGDREAAASSSGSHAAPASPAASRRPLPSRRSSRARAVRIWRTPARRRQWHRLRGPVVQFSMTGVCPASSTASQATQAADEAGSMMPTRCPPPGRRRRYRERATARIQNARAVSIRPLSASRGRDGARRACRNMTSGKWGASGRPSARAGRARTASSQGEGASSASVGAASDSCPAASSRQSPTVRKPSRLAGAWPERPSSCTASSARARLSSPRSVSRRWSSLRPAHSGPRGDASASSRSTASRSAAASGVGVAAVRAGAAPVPATDGTPARQGKRICGRAFSPPSAS